MDVGNNLKIVSHTCNGKLLIGRYFGSCILLYNIPDNMLHFYTTKHAMTPFLKLFSESFISLKAYNTALRHSQMYHSRKKNTRSYVSPTQRFQYVMPSMEKLLNMPCLLPCDLFTCLRVICMIDY